MLEIRACYPVQISYVCIAVGFDTVSSERSTAKKLDDTQFFYQMS